MLKGNTGRSFTRDKHWSLAMQLALQEICQKTFNSDALGRWDSTLAFDPQTHFTE